MSSIKWNRSVRNSVKSKCGHYAIRPVFLYHDSPAYYRIFRDGKWVKELGEPNDQRVAKKKASEHAASLVSI